ncbi:MAG: D-cysteine desulfhydrase family protein [Pseudomonadota bacterium]
MVSLPVNWPQRLSLASFPTPFHSLDRLSSALKGPRIWLKRDDLSGFLLSGNKVRKLEFTLFNARQQGYNLLITCGGLQSNHCRATAFAGAQLGIPVHLVLRGLAEGLADANLLLNYLAGARISCVPEQQYRQELDTLLESTAEHYREKGYKPYIIPTGASNGIGVWGYLAACQELKADFQRHNIQPEWIVTATGSGGTQAGLSLGNQVFALSSKVLGMAVCDDEDYFQAKVKSDLKEFSEQFPKAFSFVLPELEVATNDQYVGEGYGLASAAVMQTICDVARQEGVLFDPVYTGKAFHGLLEDIKAGRYRGVGDIVFIHTGGTFGLFPYKQQLVDIMGTG